MQVHKRLTSLAFAMVATLALAGSAHAASGPSSIALPAGFGPESLTGSGATLYSGSSSSGAVWAGSARTGKGRVLVPAHAGRAALGIAVAGGKLVVAGGDTGNLYVYDRRTGRDGRTFALGGKLINDVVVHNGVAYATDTLAPVLYRVTLDGSAPVRAIQLSGYPTAAGAPGADGIVLDGTTLIVGDIASAGLVRINPATGLSTPITLGGATLTLNDGLLRDGNRLFVAAGTGHVTRVLLSGGAASGRVTADRQVADATVDIAKAAGTIWYVDAAFQQTPDPSSVAMIRRVPRSLS